MVQECLFKLEVALHGHLRLAKELAPVNSCTMEQFEVKVYRPAGLYSRYTSTSMVLQAIGCQLRVCWITSTVLGSLFSIGCYMYCTSQLVHYSTPTVIHTQIG